MTSSNMVTNLNAKSQHVIELHLLLSQHSNSNEAAEKGISLEESLWVLVLQREQLSGSLSDLRQCQLHPPHLPLVAQAKLANKLQLL